MSTTLQKCSRCGSTKLQEKYFTKTAKGVYKKTCDNCSTKKSCPKCEYKCSANIDLKKHIKAVHSKIKDFECILCDAKFSTNGNLKQHIKMVHDKIKDFECPKCYYKCSHSGHLKKHIKMVHDKIKDFECNLCDAKFSTNGDLKQHIKQVHSKIKDFECDKCDYKFSRSQHLKQHIKQVHDKIKDFECNLCDAKFSTNGNLKQHIKAIHSKIKDFECNLCDYKCSAKSDLKQHILICTGKDTCSSGEYKIKQVLNEMIVEYEFDSSYEVKSDKGYLRWDFIINTENEPLFIEYDGKQHFIPCQFGGMTKEKAQEAFEKQKKYDKIKDDYCTENGYLLLRIPYTEYGNINKIVADFVIQNTDWGYE